MSDVQLTVGGRSASEPSSARLIITLGLAGMLSGLALSSVFQLTDPIIQRNNEAELRESVFEVVPGAATMQELQIEDDAGSMKTVFAVYDEETQFVGYAIESSAAGFADRIRLLYGYDPATQHIVGMKVLEHVETPGLGDKIIKDDSFVGQFNGLVCQPPIMVVKDGRDEPFEIDAITGATISSKAVVKAINTANAQWIDHLPSEPPAWEADPAAEYASEGEVDA